MIVVIADADPFNLSLLEEACTTAGHDVQTALDGRAVLDLVARRPPALLILEAALPGPIDGVEVARVLRADPEFAGVTIVLVDPPEGVDDCADGVLNRPYRLPDVQEELARAASEGRARRRRARESARPSSPGSPAQLLMTLEHEAVFASRFGRSLAVLVLRTADSARLADRLCACLRRVDALFVVSEKEVVSILPETDAAGARVALVRVIETVEESGLMVGISIAPEDAADAQTLLTLARQRCQLASIGESA